MEREFTEGSAPCTVRAVIIITQEAPTFLLLCPFPSFPLLNWLRALRVTGRGRRVRIPRGGGREARAGHCGQEAADIQWGRPHCSHHCPCPQAGPCSLGNRAQSLTQDPWAKQAWVSTLDLPCDGGKEHPLPKPQYSHLWNGSKRIRAAVLGVWSSRRHHAGALGKLKSWRALLVMLMKAENHGTRTSPPTGLS